MKENVKDIEASVRSRLQNKARETKRPFAEVLQYYGMERFLYRFSQSEHSDKFILKGALMFTAWDVADRRSTLDIDFWARLNNQVAAVEKAVRDVCKTSVPADGLSFDPDTVSGQKIKEDADYEGVRIKFRGFLERSHIPMQIDVGFGDIIYPKPRIIDYPVILDFPRPHLKGYTLESVVSEKFEAMVKLGLLNSRMKDFYDLWLIMRRLHCKGDHLVEALKRTFKHRKTLLPRHSPLFAEEIYNEQSDRQMLWKAFIARTQNKYAPEKLSTIAKAIEKFLAKPLQAITNEEKFNREWKTGAWE